MNQKGIYTLFVLLILALVLSACANPIMVAPKAAVAEPVAPVQPAAKVENAPVQPAAEDEGPKHRVIVTAQVEDPVQWEESYRTHGELFLSMSISRPLYYTILEGNVVATYAEPEDLDTYFEVLNSPALAEAMAADGVKRETVRVYVLDKKAPGLD